MHVIEVVALFALIAASFVFGAIYSRHIASEAVKFERAINRQAASEISELRAKLKATEAKVKAAI